MIPEGPLMELTVEDFLGVDVQRANSTIFVFLS